MLHVLVRAFNQNANGLFSLVWIFGDHSVQHRLVQGQSSLRGIFACRGNFKTGAKQSAQGLAHLNNHSVVRSHQHACVKVHVVGDVVTALFDGFFHAGISGRHNFNVDCGGALCRQAHGCWLNHSAQLLKIAQKFGRQSRFGLPRNDIGVKPIPLLLWQDTGTDLGACKDKALGHQRFHRFPNHGSTHTQLFAQNGLRWQAAPHGVLTPYDGLADKVNRVAMNVFDHSKRWSRVIDMHGLDIKLKPGIQAQA